MGRSMFGSYSGTEAARLARARNVARQTHCKRGHALSGDNLYLYTNKQTAAPLGTARRAVRCTA